MRASSSRMMSTTIVVCMTVSCYLSLLSGSRYIVGRTIVGPGILHGRLLCRYAPMKQPTTSAAPMTVVRMMILSMLSPAMVD
jgi:hypothetical protein